MTAVLRGVLDGRLDKALEQRMRPVGAAGEFGMELAADHEGMIGYLRDLDQPPIRAEAAEHHPGLLEGRPEVIVELEAVAVALHHLWHAVGHPGLCVLF